MIYSREVTYTYNLNYTGFIKSPVNQANREEQLVPPKMRNLSTFVTPKERDQFRVQENQFLRWHEKSTHF